MMRMGVSVNDNPLASDLPYKLAKAGPLYTTTKMENQKISRERRSARERLKTLIQRHKGSK